MHTFSLGNACSPRSVMFPTTSREPSASETGVGPRAEASLHTLSPTQSFSLFPSTGPALLNHHYPHWLPPLPTPKTWTNSAFLPLQCALEMTPGGLPGRRSEYQVPLSNCLLTDHPSLSSTFPVLALNVLESASVPGKQDGWPSYLPPSSTQPFPVSTALLGGVCAG